MSPDARGAAPGARASAPAPASTTPAPASTAPGGGDTARASLAGPVAAAWNALAGVYDPELYLDVVSLGLVYDVREQDGTIIVEMTMTTPGCPVSESLPEEARTAIRQAIGDDFAVDVRVVWEPPWSPDMMDEAAAAALGFRVR
jgi:metal-sulfur cluster biosynthetic enzyme